MRLGPYLFVGVFLLLDAPIQMTGTLIPIDGGFSAR